MKIKVIDEKCVLTKGYVNDAGWDLRSRNNCSIAPGETKVIETGICIEIPEGYSGDIRPRSSMSKAGLLIHYGTVDHGYTGEIKVTITNLNTHYYAEIKAYDRIAQLVITKISEDNSLEIVDKLDESSRGNNGFGSTGK